MLFDDKTHRRLPWYALFALIVACALFLIPASNAFAEETSDYQGGTIPILSLTFADDIDPDTGEVVLSGDDKIELVNSSSDHSYRATGVTLDLTVPADYDNPESDMWDGVSGYTGEENVSLEFIRGRGNSTWRNPKKPYKLKLDNKVDLFGMGPNKHWVLIANVNDHSLTIDRLVGWMGDQIGMPYTPRGVPVDLFMNGKYYGNYLLMEEVRVDGNRVDLDIVDDDAADPASIDITGDYLIGFSQKPSAKDYEHFTTSRGNTFSYDTPEYEPSLSAAQVAQEEYLAAHLERVESAVYTTSLTNEAGESVWDLIDRNSAADYWWIQEFFTNQDAYATPSTYVYKLRDTVSEDGTVETGKLYFGPLWDFDYAWGSIYEEHYDSIDDVWLSLLRQDPEFVELLKERWAVLDPVITEAVRDGGLIDGYIAEIDESWDANRQLWPAAESEGWPAATAAEALGSLKDHMKARQAWINAHLDELQTAYCNVLFVYDDEVLQNSLLKKGSGAWVEPPQAPQRDDALFLGWFDEDGKEFVRGEAVEQDRTFRPMYVEAEDATKATEVYFPQDEVWISGWQEIRYEILPVDAQDQRVVWESSDENVVVIDNGYLSPVDGCLDGRDTAEATVTAHLVGSGRDFSLHVVVYDPEKTTLPQPETITFDDEVSVEEGSYTVLKYTAEPTPNALNTRDMSLQFTCDDEDIAEVSDNGVVFGKTPGTTTVHVFKLDNREYTREEIAAIPVTVTQATPAPADDDLFTITFDLAGGTLNGSTGPIVVQCERGTELVIPDAPVRAGYTFLYWEGSEYYPGDTYVVEGDHTFTALWQTDASGDTSGGGSGSSTSTGGGQSSSTSTTPKTGDDAPFALMLSLMLVSGLCISIALAYRRA